MFLIEIEPEFRKFGNEDGPCTVELDMALYGTLEAAKLCFGAITSVRN